MTAMPTNVSPDLAPVPQLLDSTLEDDQQDDAVPESWAVVPSPDAQDGAPIRVMLVEELDRVASHIGELLAPDKRVRLVETITDGSQAVERITTERPDLVIIDALLQGQVSGAAVARALRAAGMDMPVIFLTVPEQPLKLRPELGVAEVLTLPLDGHVLLTTVLGTVAGRQSDAMPPKGTIAVFSAKGGSGRTPSPTTSPWP